MLEESIMDKISVNRSSQPQSRASAIDCKKNTVLELTYKPTPKNNKKRESPGSAPKNELFQRNVSTQKRYSPTDRKQRLRASPGFVGGTQSTGVEDNEEPEIGSVFVPGSKKQNLNHLLNFNLPTRGGTEHRVHQTQARRPVQRKHARHDHDLYLRANCQFVLKEGGDYDAYLLDPDIPVMWDKIEEIVVRSTGKSECPICLGTPSAGRVGLCGHVYCWACVLHYAETHEKQPPPCPVCTTPLHVKDMKPTRMVQWKAPGDELRMRLVRRLRGTATVQEAPPRDLFCEINKSGILPLADVNNAPYAKCFIATQQQVHEILERERKEINDQILAEIDTSEITYMEQALQVLTAKEIYMNTQPEQSKLIEPLPTENIAPRMVQKQEINENRIDWFDVDNGGAACSEVSQKQTGELGFDVDNRGTACIEVIQKQTGELDFDVDNGGPACIELIQKQIGELDFYVDNLNPGAPSFIQDDINENMPEEFPSTESTIPEEGKLKINKSHTVTDIDKENQARYFYFYQAEDGQQVFLHSLNIRVLTASWGTLSAAPRIIQGRVLHRETLPLTEQSKKHMPFTTHLPLNCSFDIIEMDLRPPHVTTAALKRFSGELQRRARVRIMCEREERRRERAWRRSMEGPPIPDISSEIIFPSAVLSSPVEPPLLSSSFVDTSPSTSAASPPSSGPSFAKMASTSGVWRVRKVVESPPPVVVADDEPSAPRALSFSDAFKVALQAAPSPSSKKKKKSKQKVLFTTGMQRST